MLVVQEARPTNVCLSCRHTEGSALSTATSPLRQGSALRSTWRGVLICWHLALQVSRAGLWGKSCCCWMGSVWGDKAHERERDHPCNVCDKSFKSLQMPSQHKIRQHSGYVFSCKGCGKKCNPNNSISRHNKLVCRKPHQRMSFCHFSMWGKDHHWGDHP